MGKQIPVEEKNEKVGGGDNPAAVLKGVLGWLGGKKQNLLSSSKGGICLMVQEPN